MPTRPAQRWASSATARSKRGVRPLIGGGDLRRGLVGGEHDPPPPAAQEGGDPVRVGGDRQPQLGGVRDELVLAGHASRPSRPRGSRTAWRRWRSTRAGSAPTARARAPGSGSAWLSSRSAIHIAASVLPVPQAMMQLAAVGALEALDRRPDRLLDVRERLLAGRAAGAQIVRRRGPRHLRKLELRAEQVADRLALVIERPPRGRAEPVGGGDQQPVGEAGPTRLGQEGVNVGLLDRVARGRRPSPGSPRGRRRAPRRPGRSRRRRPRRPASRTTARPCETGPGTPGACADTSADALELVARAFRDRDRVGLAGPAETDDRDERKRRRISMLAPPVAEADAVASARRGRLTAACPHAATYRRSAAAPSPIQPSACDFAGSGEWAHPSDSRGHLRLLPARARRSRCSAIAPPFSARRPRFFRLAERTDLDCAAQKRRSATEITWCTAVTRRVPTLPRTGRRDAEARPLPLAGTPCRRP